MNAGQLLGVHIHETADKFQLSGAPVTVSQLVNAFMKTGNVTLAQMAYAFNGNSTAGMKGDIYTRDPEAGVRDAVQAVINEYGEWDMADSTMLPDYGVAILKDGPSKYLGTTNAHEYGTAYLYFGGAETGAKLEEITAF